MKSVSRFAHRVRMVGAVATVSLLLIGSGAYADTYSVSGNTILQNGVPKSYRGANTMNIFGGNSGGTDTYNMDIVRVFVGNLKEQPLSGYTIQDSNGSWLHPLQDVINDNRAHGKVSVICPFSWDGTDATKFTGVYPPWQLYYNDYKARMRALANQFKNQPNVWIEVWNEPYPWDNAGGYAADHSWWRNNMKDMIANIRAAGFTGIVVVPGNEQGQSEKSVLARGKELLDWDTNFQGFSLAPRSLRATVSSGSEIPGCAVDGDWGTYWSTGAAQQPGQSLIIGLGTGQSFNHILLGHGNRPNDYPRGWNLYVSNDGMNWTFKTGGSGSAGTTNIWPGPQWSRWIKIEQTGSAGNWWSIAELSVTQE